MTSFKKSADGARDWEAGNVSGKVLLFGTHICNCLWRKRFTDPASSGSVDVQWRCSNLCRHREFSEAIAWGRGHSPSLARERRQCNWKERRAPVLTADPFNPASLRVSCFYSKRKPSSPSEFLACMVDSRRLFRAPKPRETPGGEYREGRESPTK